MKQASLEAQERLYEIDNDIATPIKLGKRTFYVKDVKQSVSNRISLLNVRREKLLGKEGMEEAATTANSEISSKILSLAILGTPKKIRMFHWFLWRYIYNSFTYKEATEAVSSIYGKLQLGFFFQSLVYIEEMNSLTKKLTKVEANLYRQEQHSGQKQTS